MTEDEVTNEEALGKKESRPQVGVPSSPVQTKPDSVGGHGDAPTVSDASEKAESSEDTAAVRGRGRPRKILPHPGKDHSEVLSNGVSLKSDTAPESSSVSKTDAGASKKQSEESQILCDATSRNSIPHRGRGRPRKIHSVSYLSPEASARVGNPGETEKENNDENERLKESPVADRDEPEERDMKPAMRRSSGRPRRTPLHYVSPHSRNTSKSCGVGRRQRGRPPKSSQNGSPNELIIRGRGRPPKNSSPKGVILSENGVFHRPRRRGRPPKSSSLMKMKDQHIFSRTRRHRGRPPKSEVQQRLVSGKRGRGRPRKILTPDTEQTTDSSPNSFVQRGPGRPRKSHSLTSSVPQFPRRRGRPRKDGVFKEEAGVRRRGRPRKYEVENGEGARKSIVVKEEIGTRKRGRPRKYFPTTDKPFITSSLFGDRPCVRPGPGRPRKIPFLENVRTFLRANAHLSPSFSEDHRRRGMPRKRLPVKLEPGRLSFQLDQPSESDMSVTRPNKDALDLGTVIKVEPLVFLMHNKEADVVLPRRRGRPPKKLARETPSEEAKETNTTSEQASADDANSSQVPRVTACTQEAGSGQPKEGDDNAASTNTTQEASGEEEKKNFVPKSRGRPRKSSQPQKTIYTLTEVADIGDMIDRVPDLNGALVHTGIHTPPVSRGRPRRTPVVVSYAEQENVVQVSPRPRGRPRKYPKDPDAENRPKRPRGRPRKEVDPSAEPAEPPVKRPRGRPRKSEVVDLDASENGMDSASKRTHSVKSSSKSPLKVALKSVSLKLEKKADDSPVPVPRKRGRPRKNVQIPNNEDSDKQITEEGKGQDMDTGGEESKSDSHPEENEPELTSTGAPQKIGL